MARALARHDSIFEDAVTKSGGEVVRPRGEGDSRFAVFTGTTAALQAAYDAQRLFEEEMWPRSSPLRVRMALHTGAATRRDADYYGSAVNRCARLRALASGGQVLVSGATADLAGGSLPPEVTLVDLGVHRLRDLSRSERVFQLAGPGLRSGFPPLRSVDALPNNLPVRDADLIGRELELREAVQVLRASRLVTLIGPGGAGKTQLALQAAAEALPDFPGGAWFVELAPIEDPDLVPHAVASALRVRIEQDDDPRARVIDAMLGDPTLMILDNCEHLLEACAEFASEVLDRAAEVTVIATSRELLGARGETSIEVGPLPTPLPGSTTAEILASPAVQLFLRRMTHGNTTSKEEDEASDVAAICRGLDGLPLAIELAAGITTVLDPREILDRLGARLDLLSGRSRLQHHQTVRAALDWSHELFSPDERLLFRRLAVFPATFGLSDVEDMMGDAPLVSAAVPGLLANLVRRSLVTRDPSAGPRSWRMLESVRAYASEKLDQSAEADQIRDRYLRCCLSSPERIAAGLAGPDQGIWLSVLGGQSRRLKEALKAIEGSPSFAAVVRALIPVYLARGELLAGREAASRAITLAEEGSGSEADAYSAMATFDFYLGELDSAASSIAQALILREEREDRAGLIDDLSVAGAIAFTRGEYEIARPRFERCLHLAREVGDLPRTADALNNCATIANEQGDLDGARGLYAEGLRLQRQLGNQRGIADALANLGVVEQRSGNLEIARGLHREALAICRSLRDKLGTAHALGSIGTLALRAGSLEEADRALTEALAVWVETGDEARAATMLTGLARVARERGEPSKAAQLADEAIDRARAAGAMNVLLLALKLRGSLLMEGGDEARGTGMLQEALDIADRIGDLREAEDLRAQIVG